MTQQADILVTAVGRRPQFCVTADMVKEGAVVVDVAMNRLDGKLVGDVDYEGVSKTASHITPVPGGVGPMTVIMLMKNTLIAADRQNRLVVSPVELPLRSREVRREALDARRSLAAEQVELLSARVQETVIALPEIPLRGSSPAT